MPTQLGEKHWYIVTTYSMHEAKTAENLRKRINSMNMQDYILRVLVAEQEVPVLKDGLPVIVTEKDGSTHPKTKTKNLFPGYIFVEMIMTDDSWYIVRNTPGVTGIAGSSGGGQKPTPVTNEEIEPVLKRMGMVDSSMYEHYHVGDTVKIIHGAMEGTEGVIQSIDQESGNVEVKTKFFGRDTLMTVDFSEITEADKQG